MRSRRLKLILAGFLGLCLLAVGTVTQPAATDASWTDTEAASGTFAARVIPPVTLGGTAPYCSWTTGANPGVKFQWVLPAGYTLSQVTFTAQSGTTTTALSSVSSSLSGSVYTSTVSLAALLMAVGSLSSKTVVIQVAVKDATAWVSKAMKYSFVFNAAGSVTSCSVSAS